MLSLLSGRCSSIIFTVGGTVAPFSQSRGLCRAQRPFSRHPSRAGYNEHTQDKHGAGTQLQQPQNPLQIPCNSCTMAIFASTQSHLWPLRGTTLTCTPGTPWRTGGMRNGLRIGGMQVGCPGQMSSGADIDRPYWA